jgi:hypothetical protein
MQPSDTRPPQGDTRGLPAYDPDKNRETTTATEDALTSLWKLAHEGYQRPPEEYSASPDDSTIAKLGTDQNGPQPDDVRTEDHIDTDDGRVHADDGEETYDERTEALRVVRLVLDDTEYLHIRFQRLNTAEKQERDRQTMIWPC